MFSLVYGATLTSIHMVLFSVVTVWVYTVINSARGLPFLRTLSSNYCVQLFGNGHSERCGMILHCSLISLLLLFTDVGSLFTCQWLLKPCACMVLSPYLSSNRQSCKIRSISTQISTSHPVKLDLSPWELMFTSHLTGGRFGNVANCGQCNMSTSFKGYVWFHHLSFLFFFFFCLPQECQHPRQALLLSLNARRKKQARAGPTLGLEQHAMVVRQKPSLWSAETNNCVTSPPTKSIVCGFTVCQELGKHHFLDFTTTVWRGYDNPYLPPPPCHLRKLKYREVKFSKAT